MSFRGDDSRRYGHVPPAQYPVAGAAQDSSNPPYPPQRRMSFNTGDDAAMFDPSAARQQPAIYTGVPVVSRAEEELFLGSPTSQDAPAAQNRLSYKSQHIAMAGYQHQYQAQTNAPPPAPAHSTYNPQAFARTQSTSLPYHPAPASRYGAPTSPTYAPTPTTYTQPAYNPAAYANTNTATPQRHSSVASVASSGYNGYTYGYTSPGIPQSGFGQSPQSATAPSIPSYEPARSPQYPPSSATATSPQYDQSYPPANAYNTQQYYGSYPVNASGMAYNTMTSQAPYPTAHVQMPAGPSYASADHAAFSGRNSRSDSQVSAPSPPPHSQAPGGLTRHPTNAPLPSRPMDDLPEHHSWGPNGQSNELQTQDALFGDIISEVESRQYRGVNGNISEDDQGLHRYSSTASTNVGSAAAVHRYPSNASTVNRNDIPDTYPNTYDYDDDESDPEGAAGLLAMQEDMDDRRFGFGGISFPTYMEPPAAQQQTSPTHPIQPPGHQRELPPPPEEQGTDSDFGGMDLGLYGGGYAGNLHYGNEVGSPPATSAHFDQGPRPLPYPQNTGSEYAPFSQAAVDYGGTGGLQAPQTHRLSFDEGDERVSIHSRHSGSDSPTKEEYPDMFYHPGISNRPLPAVPPLGESRPVLSVVPPSRVASQQGYNMHVNPQRLIVSQDGYDSGTPTSLAAYDMITLPGRKRKFIPSKLTATEIKRCAEPWALSSVTAWIREMADGEVDLKRKSIEEGIVKLFCHKVPTMNVADAESLSATVVDSMFASGLLIPDEEWVRFGAGHMTGVLWQLTGHGCYAPKLHEAEESAPKLNDNGIPVRCYSHHCGRTLKKANLDHLLSDDPVVQDWATFHGVKPEDCEKKSKKEIERQNVLHEIVTSEEEYMAQLDVVRLLYRDQLRVHQPPVLPNSRRDKFLEAVFGKVDTVQQINKDHLLAQLKYRQQEQAPFIVGFSDLFREWIRKARPIYIEYCSSYPNSEYLIRKESNRNILFREFLGHVQNHRRSKRLGWTTFVKAPITRLQRYSLLLSTVLKNTIEDSEEKQNLIKAIDEIRSVTKECDDRVAEMTKKVSLLELQQQLVLRPGFQSVLNLDHLGRELLKQGELQRQGSKGVRWVDTQALLFDHYFILAKAVSTKDGRNEKKYDVSKEPIPMPLLFLESMHDEPVTKQKGLAAPLTRTAATAGSGTQLNKIASNGGDRPGLEHSATSVDDGKIIYPFRIKHLGHEIYTLYASSALDRSEWCKAIVDAKTRHAEALHAQNAEPFRLRVLSDGAFAYDSYSTFGRQPGVPISGTPLDRAIRGMEEVYGKGRGPPPVCRAQVNCATAFKSFGKSIIAIGTDYGVYISEASNPRGWTRSVQISKVTQIAVLEDFSVCILISDRSLISYPLDVIAPVSNFPSPVHDNPRRAPQRLAKDVTFFATARMKDRTLLFYKRKEGMHNTFKVLEPVFQKATEKKSRIFGSRKFGSGATESFRDYDEFYIPAECYSLNLFQSYIAVASAKGFELLTLDKKVTQSIPRDLNLPAIANIASRIKDQRPLGMFKLNDQEFLLTYEDCAVYVDKHGEISRTLIMEYSGKQKKAKAATMFGQYLLLFNEDYVEVRNAENGRLRQIIAGRDVRCLDYGFRGPTGSGQQHAQPHTLLQAGVLQDTKGTVKICMSHPEVPGGQIVLEMLLNDGHAEKA
ncbi:CNH domain-containing protein [Neurospora hispaniola]|uniref:CNH domain-containing protein n=1 Tax=Neurospora hispaniola TaxID=588809 RepID=A0AAJ0I4D9_9PEZI|nr:CNH domain-containing protein [Neurospora hispaniola]